MKVSFYTPENYSQIEKLYKDSSTFGGQFDEARDTQERLDALVLSKPESILVAEDEGRIVGTVTLFEDGRSAWLYRCAVLSDYEKEAIPLLVAKAKEVLKNWGHRQMLVYAPAGDAHFEERYENVGFKKGNNFTAFWQNL
jgi:predicted N-acetyltransferase YhbS